MNKLWLFIAIDIVLFLFKRRHLGQRNVEHFTLPSQHLLLITGNWSRNGCRELSFTPGHYYVMTLRNDIMRFSVSGFGSDIRIELQAPVVKQGRVFLG